MSVQSVAARSDVSNRKAKILRIDHLYDFYELYQCIYGRRLSYKVAEAEGLSMMLADAIDLADQYGFDEMDELRLLEFLGGRNEHLRFIRPPNGSKITEYRCIDMVVEEDEEVAQTILIKGDVLQAHTYDIVKTLNPNFIFAMFFSASSVLDYENKDNPHSILTIEKMFKAAYQSLADGGSFVLDYVPTGFESSIAATGNAVEEETEVGTTSALRSYFGLKNHTDVKIKYTHTSTYNRITGITRDQFVGPFTIHEEGKLIAQVYVESDFTQRYFSETEIIAAAVKAGFTDFKFYNFDYDNGEYKRLETEVCPEEEGEDMDDDDCSEYYSTNILCFKNRAENI